ncbi:endonuclease [uncultured Flavobacterium sp.]|uniref:endonuclease n=1 Tax=uncultured Flavobacterium sp. TaxID=165435 RepID=UPI0030ECF1C5|tara:strand:+ start:460 stop:1581 length:1122 start_codon:yes stop_codon:yes gene_type:complete
MKKNYILLFLLSVTMGFAQIPTGYYSSATGTGYTLKTQLYNIIKNHNDQGYGALWTLYSSTAFRDNYYENNGSLLDMYSENPTGSDSYEYTSTSQQCGNYSGEGSCYNREHLVPQSYFDNYAVDPMKNDGHFVVPSDGYVNGQRNNFPFGKVGSASWTSTNGSKKGNNLNSGYSAGYSNTVFEPIDEFKGDIARSLFYFATRYENIMSNFYTTTGASTDAKVMFDGSNNKAFSDTFLNILITWHTNDPVSAKEIAINNRVFQHQANRNPFIDHPEYVCQIWPTQCAALSTQDFVSLDGISVYPNPSNNHSINIQSEVALDEIQLINLNGQLIQVINKPVFNNNTYTIDNLPQGFYLLRLSSENQSVTKKIIVN